MTMPAEVTVLALAGLLQVVQFGLMSVPANIELGTAKTLSPRDPQRMSRPLMDQTSLITGRLYRAFNNHFEALILFTLAVVVVTLGDQSTAVTRTAAWIYLIARVAYIPAYALGWVPWRSVIYGVGLLATVVMLLAALI